MPMIERRATPRFMLKLHEGNGALTALVDDCGSVHCELLDISSGGMRGRLLTPDKLCAPMREGQTIALTSFASRKLSFLAGKTGRIAWANTLGGEFGVQFHEELPPDQVEAMIFHFSTIFG